MLDVKAGDEQSFELLLQRYRTPLVNFLYRMVRAREEAEDLAQEVFLRVYRARKDYVPSAKFTTWLFRIATNLALNSVRDNRHQRMEISLDAPVTVDAEDGDEKPLDIAEKHPNIEQYLVEEARKKMIKHAIDKLAGETARGGALAQVSGAGLRRYCKDSRMLGERAEIAALSRIRNASSGTSPPRGERREVEELQPELEGK